MRRRLFSIHHRAILLWGSLALFWFVMSSCSSDLFLAPPKQPIGWIEKVSFPEFDAVLDAKLDTGADTSSLHADSIQVLIGSKGENVVEFRVEDHNGEYQILQLPLSRRAKIKTKGGYLQVRPVVTLGVCVGAGFEEVEFTLVDRSHFDYPVLIGRNFLAGKFLVDSSRSFTFPPACDAAEVSK